MLQSMRQPAPSQPSPSLSTFAGLLATLASPPSPSDTDNAPPWNSNGLGEDVATLSYERALRTHARYRTVNRELDRESVRADGSLTAAADPGSDARADAPVETGAAGAFGAAGAVGASGAMGVSGGYDASSATVAVHAAPGLHAGTARDSDLRSASVTIRLSRAECTRLHQRAAEAGLTVSAYLVPAQLRPKRYARR